MANAMYDLAREVFLNATSLSSSTATSVVWGTGSGGDTIKCALVTSSYTYSAAHTNYSQVSANVLGTPQTLASKTVTGGVADAADPQFTGVSSGTVHSVVIYKDTGTASTSTLICFLDTGTGFDLVANGGTITVTFNASGIFKV